MKTFTPNDSECLGFSACRWCAHKNIQEGYDKPACDFSYEGV